MSDYHDKVIQELQTELDKYKWVSVKDRMPKKGERVLLYSKNTDFEIGTSYDNYIVLDDGCPMSLSYLIGINAHWMPLPEPPEKPYEEWDRISKERKNGGSDAE